MHSKELLQPRSGEFLRPGLHGARFDDGSISLDVLGELAALRAMVLEVARWQFLGDNPDRQRSPRRFNRIDLKLTRIDHGSTVPVISLVPDDALSIGMRSLYQHYYEHARDAIINVIGAAEYSESPAMNWPFPSHLLSHFSRIGRSLRNDEWIEFLTPNRIEPARLTKQSRLRLLQWSSLGEVSYVTLRGVVSEADRARMTFEIQPEYGPKISGPIPIEYLGTIMMAFSQYDRGQVVMVEGMGRRDRNGRPYSLESVESITLLASLDVPTRLEKFRRLKDGWLEGGGLAPDHAGLDWLTNTFQRAYPVDLPLPHLYPTFGGGVQAEWLIQSYDVSLEIDLFSRHAEWHSLNLDTDEDEVRLLNMIEDRAWSWVANRIRSLSEARE